MRGSPFLPHRHPWATVGAKYSFRPTLSWRWACKTTAPPTTPNVPPIGRHTEPCASSVFGASPHDRASEWLGDRKPGPTSSPFRRAVRVTRALAAAPYCPRACPNSRPFRHSEADTPTSERPGAGANRRKVCAHESLRPRVMTLLGLAVPPPLAARPMLFPEPPRSTPRYHSRGTDPVPNHSVRRMP
jgi:hypothetical protein